MSAGTTLRSLARGTFDRVGDQAVRSLGPLQPLCRLPLARSPQVIDEPIEEIFGRITHLPQQFGQLLEKRECDRLELRRFRAYHFVAAGDLTFQALAV